RCSRARRSAEGLLQQESVPDPLVAHGQGVVAAQGHQLLDHDGAGQDDVRPLSLQTANSAALARAEGLEALAQLRDVAAAQPGPVERRAIPLGGSQKEAAERAEAAADADQRVAGSGPGQHAEQTRTRLAAKCLDLSGAGRIVSQES